MSQEEDLQRQVERLRKERDSILNPPPDELAKRITLLREFAEIDEANDKRGTKAVEQRVGVFFQSKGVALPRSILTVEAELGAAEAGLANARGEPVAFAVRIDPGSLEADSQSGMEFRPDLSGSGEVFIQSDFGDPLLLLRGSIWGEEGRPKDLGLVALTFTKSNPLHLWGVTLVKIGYPNEEAFGEQMVTGFHGIGFYEVLNSEWSQEIVRANREKFPETPDDLGLRHFMVACKEQTLEVLARDFTISEVRSGSWLEAVTTYLEA